MFQPPLCYLPAITTSLHLEPSPNQNPIERDLTPPGIGYAILSLLLTRPQTTVIAAVRSTPVETLFASLPRHETSDLLTVEIDAKSDSDVPRAAELIRAHGIMGIDVVIAAAGMVSSLESIIDTDVGTVLEHVNVNCGGVLRLIKGLWDLLQVKEGAMADKELTEEGNGCDASGQKTCAASMERKFAVISSSCGSIEEMEPVPTLAYGVSKAAVNFLTRKLSDEWDGCSVAVHPGWVKTEMGTFAAKSWGAKEAPMEVEDSARAVLSLVSLVRWRGRADWHRSTASRGRKVAESSCHMMALRSHGRSSGYWPSSSN
jgi:norsolorinic acid ketoreductase